jgi:hypothetical protein
MTSTIERDFVIKDGVASFPMKEYPNYCGIEDIGYIPHGEWADAELEYKGKLFNENVVSDAMWERFIEEFPDKDGDYEAFNQYMYDNKDEVYKLLEDWSDENEKNTKSN